MATIPFTKPQQSAFDIMTKMLADYGLSSLGGTLRTLILSGVTDANQLDLALQQTDEWKVRFAGNEKLRAAGLPVLSVAEYLSVERSYAQVLKNYGLPQGFYDDPADFSEFIGNSISSSELQSRAQMYADAAKREDPAVLEQLSAMGMGQGDVLAFMMDPDRALPLVQRKYQSALIGAAGRRQGMTTSTDRLGGFADLGVTEQQANEGYGQISETLATTSRLGQTYGESFTQSDAEDEVFGGNGNAAAKRKRLASRERASFSGQSGVGRGSLARGSAGSY